MMDVSTLLPLLLTGASTGLTCGLSCGACGNPMVNVFLAGYLFTHTDHMKKSLTAFAAYHVGKAVTVSLLCVCISWFGSQIVDKSGNLFGINLQKLVTILMLLFVFRLIIQWIREWKGKDSSCCSGNCMEQTSKSGKMPMKTLSQRLLIQLSQNHIGTMFFYGAVSGMSPCASMVVVLGYASALRVGEAILVGLCFSLANSVVPLLILTALTGLLTEQMHKEIPQAIRYFQLASYLIFAFALVRNLGSIL